MTIKINNFVTVTRNKRSCQEVAEQLVESPTECLSPGPEQHSGS